MNPSLSEHAVFSNALARIHPGERAAYLDGACGGNSAFRHRIESLLAAVPLLDGFLEEPPADLTPVGALVKQEALERIGRYRLLEVIGEGGCGVVYMAEQEESLRRRVAIKVIKPGMDSRSVVARFEAERQALALMDHPNIARVHDAGTTALGRPFFVMELVRGVRITEYCDQARLDTRSRLGLVIQVCRAVQHAHQKGIIHRDLKPSNILVTVNDGIPVPKVIDFGIAKATGQRLTEKTVFTHFHAFLGTPAYTSPEQAEMSSVDVDTRADIYSLGVLIYELLTGRPPFDGDTLLRSGIDEMRRILREVDPPCPSRRLSTLDAAAATELSRRRQVAVPELVRTIRGDLDWIVMRCLEKDRGRRYETANALLLDLERYLADEPIEARPPDALYRFGKRVRRHRWAVLGVTCVVLALMGGLVTSFWQASIARSALAELRSSAPAFVEQARVLADREHFVEAIEKLEYAIRLRPDVIDYRMARAALFRATLDLGAAQVAYEEVLKLRPEHPLARVNLEMCTGLLAAPLTADGRMSRDSLGRILRALETEDRPAAERMPAARLLGEETGLLRDYWMTRLASIPLSVDRPLATRFKADPSGHLMLDLSGSAISDLSVLEGMPLDELNLTGCTSVRDLRPLAAAPLQRLRLGGTRVRDLRALEGCDRLSLLDLAGTPVSDLSPLSGLRLTELSLERCVEVRDLEPLRGLPIEELSLRNTRVADLGVLATLPVAVLDLTGVPAVDFSPLRGRSVRRLNLQRTRVRDLAFLQGMPLEQLTLHACREAYGFGVLGELPVLETLLLPVEFRSLPEAEQQAIDRLRGHPRLRQIGVEIMDGMAVTTTQTREVFWRDRELEERIAAPLRALGLRHFILTRFPNGTYALNLNGDALGDLSWIPSTAPISHLNLSHTQVSDLSPIRNLPITRLDLVGTRVSRLEPLAGMPLKELFLSHTLVRDLAPLSGLPLHTVYLMGTPVTDLAPLLSVESLRELLLPTGATNVDLLRRLPKLERVSFLWHAEQARAAESAGEFWKHRAVQTELFRTLEVAGIPYAAHDSGSGGWTLAIHDPRFSDVSLLRGLPIHHLDVDGSSVRDLSPLKDSSIAVLNLRETPLDRLESLDGTALGRGLKELRVSRTGIHDLGPLRNCRALTLLDVGGTTVSNLEPLRSIPIEHLYLTGTPVRDLSPLSGMPLRSLYLDRCPEVRSVAELQRVVGLEELMLPSGAPDIAELKGLTRLQRVGFRWVAGIGPEHTATDFWELWSRGRIQPPTP